MTRECVAKRRARRERLAARVDHARADRRILCEARHEPPADLHELAPAVRVVAFCPGGVLTNLHRSERLRPPEHSLDGLRAPRPTGADVPRITADAAAALLLDAIDLGIDHVLTDGGAHAVRARLGPDLGSDHLPLVTTIRLPEAGRGAVARP